MKSALTSNKPGRKKHVPFIIFMLVLLLIFAWAAFFFPAFTTIDGLNE